MQFKSRSYLLRCTSMGSTTLLANALPLLVILAPLSNVHAPLNAKLRAAPMLSTLASYEDLSVGTVGGCTAPRHLLVLLVLHHTLLRLRAFSCVCLCLSCTDMWYRPWSVTPSWVTRTNGGKGVWQRCIDVMAFDFLRTQPASNNLQRLTLAYFALTVPYQLRCIRAPRHEWLEFCSTLRFLVS